MSVSAKIINAALRGPEVKEVRINEPNSSDSHEFNVKPVSYRVFKDEVTVYGQISHHLSFRDDDQIWYTFKKSGKTITPSAVQNMVVEKKKGGAIKTILKLKPVGVAIGAYFGVNAGKYFDMVREHSDKLEFIDLDSGWEKAVGNFLEDLTKRANRPDNTIRPGLQFFEHDNLRGKDIFIKVGQNVKHTKTIGWNDRASSLLASVPEGKKLELYQHDNFTGRILELGPGSHIIRDLKIHNMGDELTSILWEKA